MNEYSTNEKLRLEFDHLKDIWKQMYILMSDQLEAIENVETYIQELSTKEENQVLKMT